MFLSLFPKRAALALFVLSSGLVHAASQDSDAFPKKSRSSSVQKTVLLDPDLSFSEDQTRGMIRILPHSGLYDPRIDDQQTTSLPQASSPTDPLSEEDLLIAELMRERDQALKKAQEAEAKVYKQAQLIELMKQRDEAIKKAQEAEALSAKQAQQMEELKAKSNPPAKQGSSSVPSRSVKAPAPQPQPTASASIPRAVVDALVIPEVARGYEDIYRRFLGGKLIYTDPSSKAKKELPIRALSNPLEGTFDLSGCGDTGQYLSISTGYRKAQKAENASKVEIWLAPWFLVNKNLSASAKHLQPIMGSWDAASAPVGLFWTWGGWSVLGWYDYLVSESLACLSSEDLYEKWKRSQIPQTSPQPHIRASQHQRLPSGRSSAAHHFMFCF